MQDNDAVARAIHRLSDKIDTVIKAIERHDGKLDTMAQGLVLLSEGLTHMQSVMDETHEACTKERPKSEMKPLLEQIKDSCEKTCDAVLGLPELIHDAVSVAVGGMVDADPS
jgi:hypothetical protein